jgi:hypothetical protein
MENILRPIQWGNSENSPSPGAVFKNMWNAIRVFYHTPSIAWFLVTQGQLLLPREIVLQSRIGLASQIANKKSAGVRHVRLKTFNEGSQD